MHVCTCVYAYIFTYIFTYIYTSIIYKNARRIFGLCCRRNELGALRRKSDPGLSRLSQECLVLQNQPPTMRHFVCKEAFCKIFLLGKQIPYLGMARPFLCFRSSAWLARQGGFNRTCTKQPMSVAFSCQVPAIFKWMGRFRQIFEPTLFGM